MLSTWTRPEDQKKHSQGLSVWCRSYSPKGQDNLAQGLPGFGVFIALRPEGAPVNELQQLLTPI
jgi:hypothetical protein